MHLSNCLYSFCSQVFPAMLLALFMGIPVSQGQQDTVVAAVGNKAMTLYDLQRQTAFEAANIQMQGSGEAGKTALLKLYKKTIRDFVERELIYLEFKSFDKHLPADYINQQVDLVAVARTGGDRLQFEDLLAEKGIAHGGVILPPGTTMDEFEDLVEKLLAVEIIYQDRVMRGIRISPTNIKAQYDEHPEDYTQEAAVRLQVILLKAKGRYAEKIADTVAEIYRKLDEGIAFGKLAKTYSEGPKAQEEGIQDWSTQSFKELVPIIAKLAPGDVHPTALKPENNTYIIKLIAKRESGLRTLDEDLQAEIGKFLRKAEQRRRHTKFLAELREKYPVKKFYAD